MKSTRHQYSILLLLTMVVCAACGAWIVRQYVSFRHETIKVATYAKLYVVGLGIANYLDQHGHLPDPVIHSSSGIASSWRVHVIQQFDGGHHYKAYDFRQPWDGATNLPLADAVPEYYQDPIQSASPPTFTLVPLSKQETQLLFPSFAPHVTNGCVAVVAINSTPPPFVWIEPRDIGFDDLKRHLLQNPQCFVLLVADSGHREVMQANEWNPGLNEARAGR